MVTHFAAGITHPMSQSLATRVARATGADTALDADIAGHFGVALVDYTQSVPDCWRLANSVLPDWQLHTGFTATGLLPYAALSKGDRRVAAEAPTVPLAILRALMAAASQS